MPSTIAPPTPSPSPPLVVIDKGCTTVMSTTEHILLSSISVSCATLITHPLDLVKVRLQLLQQQQQAITSSSSSSRYIVKSGHINKLAFSPTVVYTLTKDIIHNEGGMYALFKGCIPALFRASIYGGARLGLYSPIKTALESYTRIIRDNDHTLETNTITQNSSSSSSFISITAALLSGSIAAIIGNPLEVLKVRLQSSSTRYQRKDNAMMIIMNVIMTNVSSSSHEHKKEYSTLYTNLWRGTSMSVIRAALLTASQIISYTTLKTYITNKRDSIHMPYINDPTISIIAGLISGIVATTITSPFDVLKTMLMSNRGGRDKSLTPIDNDRRNNGII